MASRLETGLWEISEEETVIEDSIEKNVNRLADFIADGAPDSVEITSLIPSTNPSLGIKYALILRRETEKNGEVLESAYQVDGNIFEALHSAVELWSEEQVKDNEEFVGSVLGIAEYIRNPYNWPEPAYKPNPH